MDLDTMITLPAHTSDSLLWPRFEPDPERLWHLDLGLELLDLSKEDPMLFQSLSLGVRQFVEVCVSKEGDYGRGVILYKGLIPFRSSLENKWDQIHLITHYIQLLTPLLPEDLPVYLFFAVPSGMTPAEAHYLVSRERFPYVQLALKGLPSWKGWIWDDRRLFHSPSISQALCFPEESACLPHHLLELNQWMKSQRGDFQVIEECFLTEVWDGVDQIYAFPEMLSPLGKRKLQGFQATGGEVIYINSSPRDG